MIRLAYLQVGPPPHGICRYGRLLAAEARGRPDLAVIEENVHLEGKFGSDRCRLSEVARRLSASADVVHLQVSLWSDTTWGSGWHSLANLWTFWQHCRRPIVITLHDIDGLAYLESGALHRIAVRAAREVLRGLLRRGPCDLGDVYRWGLAVAASRAASSLLVITAWERALLRSKGITRDTVLIPHFVEHLPAPRPGPATPTSTSMKTIAIAGFILNSKGYRLLIEALPSMPDVRVVFIGGPGVGPSSQQQYAEILDLVRQRGIGGQLEVTGYLPDEEFRRRLGLVDLAICPFIEYKSASGSLSTLIAVGCPILASDVPLITEYNAIVPGAVHTFAPYTPEALADAVRRLLAEPRDALIRGVGELRKRLSISTIYDRHVDVYRQVVQIHR
jgi:glycosyltransferase involved in cell wall biosynthesis